MVVALLLVSVFALVLVWMKRQWSTTTKVVITAAVAGLIIFVLLSAAGDSSEQGLVATGPIPTTDAPSVASTTLPADDVDVVLTSDDYRQYLFPMVFDATRAGLIEILEDDDLIASVITMAYDPDTAVVAVDIVPAFDFDSGVRDDAWAIMQAFGTLYDDDVWFDPDTGFAPGLDVTISTARYQCDANTMLRISDGAVTRDQWESTCRLR